MKLIQQQWHKNVAKSLYVMDGVLLIFFALAFAPQATGIAIHEWVSFVLVLPFIIHLMVHWSWLENAFRKLFILTSGDTRFNFIWGLFLYFMVLMVMVSGVLVSQSALPAIGLITSSDSFWHATHHNLGNLLMPMLGIHLAMHWQFIRSVTGKFITDRKKIERLN